jgi:BMFP domain-containing protein YqiC
MPQTRGQFFDDISRLFSDAAGLADNARREVETLGKAQIEKLLSTMNVVSREEFEAVREMAVRAREENDRLAAKLAALEARSDSMNQQHD